MSPNKKAKAAWTSLSITVGSGLFFLALLVSAAAVPQLRLLHLLQALIYVLVVVYGRRHNAYALGAGFTIAAAWNSIETFGPHLVQTGAAMIWAFLRTGRAEHLETMMVPIGAVGHLILLASCLTVFMYHVQSARDWLKFVGGGALALAYSTLIIVIARPQ